MSGRALATILPPGALCREQVGAFSGWLFPEEAALVAGAASARREEFAAGRTCARAALEALGWPSAPLLRDDAPAPAWPRGVTGSLTHCEGYCAAAVARSSELAGLGIDAEPNAALPPAVRELVATPSEAVWLEDAPRGAIAWDRLVFSIKESVYKAWSPLARSWLDFQDATVAIDVAQGAFEADIVRPAAAPADAPRVVRGRFVSTGAHLLTCAAIPARHVGA